MGRRLALVLALAATLAVPFWLRPRSASEGPADDTVVVVTPNNEAIRHEFALGFETWYRARTGRTVAVDWRVLGGTSEIARLIDGEYLAAFRNMWTGRLGRPWGAAVQAAIEDGRVSAGAPAAAQEARSVFLASDVGCGIDVFFGGGTYDFDRQVRLGTLVPTGLARMAMQKGGHPGWFGPGAADFLRAIPASYEGNPYRDPGGRWYGCVTSCYGILYNRDGLRRLGVARPPEQWSDLADPRYAGQIALCDPTKSGSIASAFENIIQQQMHRQVGASPNPSARAAAVRRGWIAGLRLIQAIGANARYFTDDSEKPEIDVADGNCAAGLCIDFYGREQEEALRRRANSDRLGFVAPAGGTSYAVDPIGLLRGAPHRSIGLAFITYVLSLDGQKLWAFRPGAPGGPRTFALRRLPVRRDFYARGDWKAWRSDPEADPYGAAGQLAYRAAWTGGVFREMAFIVRVMCEDTHGELAAAWRAIARAPQPRRQRATAILQDLSAVDYDRTRGVITRALTSPNRVEEVQMARVLADGFRRQYVRAEAVADGGR